MLFEDNSRWSYANSQLREVICQLRFPTILSINEKAPADFQDAIRDAYPRYEVRKQQPAPRVLGIGTPNAKVEQGEPVNCHSFVSSTGIWKIVLTQNSIAITTMRYNNWEDLAQRFDRPLAEFIRIYQPAWFERIGLRYLNVFSRKSLGLEETPWRELFAPAYLGVLSDPEVDERRVRKSSIETEMLFPDGTQLKLHTGPGMLRQKGQNDPEVKFIMDMDCAAAGQIEGNQVTMRLEQLHDHAARTFRGAITDTLHEAMGANPL